VSPDISWVQRDSDSRRLAASVDSCLAWSLILKALVDVAWQGGDTAAGFYGEP
jgi:hypothetical protein